MTKSPIKNINKRLTEIKDEFDLFYFIFHPGLQLVNHFSDRITFHSPESSNDKGLIIYLSKLDISFSKMQTAPADIAVITDRSIKVTGLATAVTHIWKDNKVINCLKAYAINVIPLEAKLMAICIGLMSALESTDAHYIIVITDSLAAANKIISLDNQHLQKSIIPIAAKIQMFLEKDGYNSIYFWYCPSKLKWPRHALVDEEAKTSYNPPSCQKKIHSYSAKRKNAISY